MDRSAEIANRDAGPAPSAAAAEPEERQSKRRKTTHTGSNVPFTCPPPAPLASRWRTSYEQRIFLSNLLSALRRVRSGESLSSTPHAPVRSSAVRDASDRILAAAAGGRSRWSRAVLRRHRSACRKVRDRKAAATASLERERMERMRKRRSGGENANADLLRAKAKVLGRLVPGCRKTSFPSLLEETSDYIAALEMQVRAMSALAEMLSSMGSGGSVAPPPRG